MMFDHNHQKVLFSIEGRAAPVEVLLKHSGELGHYGKLILSEPAAGLKVEVSNPFTGGDGIQRLLVTIWIGDFPELRYRLAGKPGTAFFISNDGLRIAEPGRRSTHLSNESLVHSYFWPDTGASQVSDASQVSRVKSMPSFELKVVVESVNEKGSEFEKPANIQVI